MKSLIISALVLIISCSPKEQTNVPDSLALKTELLETDRAFSKMSVERGMKKAFIEYLDSNGVLLRPGHLPIAGAEAIDYLIQQNDTGYTLAWQPHNGYAAKSGELGYTYGIYSLKPSVADTIIYGSYVTIWRKQGDGSWKYVLDSGNEGIGLNVQ